MLPRSPSAPLRRLPAELALLVAVAAALGFCGITWGLPNEATDWSIDSIAPLGPLSYAADMLRQGHWSSKYPPLHFTLLALLYAPYLAYLWATGDMTLGVSRYPYGLADPATSLTVLILIARGVSALMGVGTAVAAYLIARDLAGRRAGFFAGILFAASPLAVYYAGSGNLDMPYMCWSSLALLFAVRVARGTTLRTYVLLGVTAAAAMATKDQAYGLFLLLPIPLLVIHYRRGGRLLDRRLLAGFAAALATYVIAANLWIDLAGWLAHLRFITDDGSVPYRMFPPTVAGYGALAARTAHLFVDSTTVAVVALAAVGVGWAARRRARGARILLFAAAAYLVLFLAPILYVLPRFVLPAVFVSAIFAGIGASVLWRGPGLARKAVVTIALCYAVTYGISMNLGLLWDSRYAAERWLTENVEPGAVIGSDAAAYYLPRLPNGTRTASFHIEDDDAGDARPDYLVFSEAQYRKYLRHDHLRARFEDLLSGARGYEIAAIFHQGGLPVTELIPGVNPRIVIMRQQRPPAGHVMAGDADETSLVVAFDPTDDEVIDPR